MPYDGYNDRELNDMIRPIHHLDADLTNVCFPTPHRAFNGAAWSTYPKLQHNTNCYCYALGMPEMGNAQPGSLIYAEPSYSDIGEGFTIFNEEDVRDRVTSDGLIMISESEAMSGNVHAIAMTVATDDDFHFFLRDADGTWSDKMGCKAVQKNPHITIPSKHALTDRYKKFAGYYTIPAQGIDYTPRLSIPAPILRLF